MQQSENQLSNRTLKVFTAEWCQPCKQLKKVLADTKLEGVNVVTVDIDAWKEEAKQAGVRSVPTSILTEAGVELARKSGVMTKDALTFFVNREYGFTAPA